MKSQERFEAELDRDKRKWVVRRRMAIWAFVCNIAIALAYIIIPAFFLNADQADVLANYNSVIITIISFFSSIDMLYIGAATYADSVSKVTNSND